MIKLTGKYANAPGAVLHALRDGPSISMISIVSGSFGLQIGAEAKDIVIAFMTREALDGFRAGQGGRPALTVMWP